MNLKEYSDKILRPSALAGIENGSCDKAIQLKEVIDFYKNDAEMMKAIKSRLKVINSK